MKAPIHHDEIFSINKLRIFFVLIICVGVSVIASTSDIENYITFNMNQTRLSSNVDIIQEKNPLGMYES